MVFSRRLGWRLAVRLLWLTLLAVAAAFLAVSVRAPTAALLAFAGAGAACLDLWRLVSEGNAELTRFLAALERADLAQSFRHRGRGAGFDQLGAAYERVLDRLRDERASGVGAARFAEALIDGTPTPMLVLGPDDEVGFVNKAARRLFDRAAPCPLDVLGAFGPPFVAALRSIAPGRTALTHLLVDGLSQRAALDATAIHTAGGARRIVSVRVMQAELDEAELAAQVDLVRVLTHEVMNSLTPVTSLAGTALRLVDAVDARAAPGVADAQLAIGALSRRAAELERFVESYKGFSDTPTLRRGRIDLGAWFDELAGLFAATPAGARATVGWHRAGGADAIDGDAGLLTQVMLNILKNAGEALAETPDARIDVTAAVAGPGRVRIAVADNGAGIDPAIAQDVFLPFFTTKRDGTGVGLSFARQVVLLHGGQIAVVPGKDTHIEMLLPTPR